MIGVIGGDTHFGRVVDLFMRSLSDLALVACREVEDGEERLILVGSVSPMPFPATFIPYLTFLAEVVIFFGLVRAVVAELTQVSGVHLVAGGQARHAAHVLCACRGWVHARDNRCAGGSAHWSVGDGPGVDHALFCQGVEVGCGGIIVSVATKVRSVVFARYPEYVGQFGRVGSECSR